jgi:hypothetical protein
MTVRPSFLVVALCLGSLFDWQPVRSGEQALSALLRPTDGLVQVCLPTFTEPEQTRRALAVREAREAWGSWEIALRSGARSSDARRELAVVPVVEPRRSAQELIVRVPPGAVLAGAAVTSHGVLLGFLRPWRRDAERVESGGLARVALLGNPKARPVAAEWRASAESPAVHFLLTSGAEGPTIAHTSREGVLASGQLAYTRDASIFGDALPGGLLLGRVKQKDASDIPGGALAESRQREGKLESLVDAYTLDHVVLEVDVGVPWEIRETSCRAFASTSRRGRLRLDAGMWNGIASQDLVVQDGVFIGQVKAAGPWSSEVHRELPPGKVLVVSPEGEVVSTTPLSADWPRDWVPQVGWRVVVGHRVYGGFLAGEIREVGPRGFSVERPLLDPEGDLQVFER